MADQILEELEDMRVKNQKAFYESLENIICNGIGKAFKK